MLESLETDKIVKWQHSKIGQKTRKKLKKLKDQPSKTAGLETVLSLAVGCRVMLMVPLVQ